MYTNSEIFCEKLLLLLVLCIGLSGPAHPPKVKYSVKSCCCLFYVLAFQDQHTLPKWNILSQSSYCRFERIFHFGRVCWSWKANSNNNSFETEYFTLGGCAGPERPIHRTSNNNSFSQNISLWEGVLVLKGQYIEQATITAFHRIFHFGRVCWSWKAYT